MCIASSWAESRVNGTGHTAHSNCLRCLFTLQRTLHMRHKCINARTAPVMRYSSLVNRIGWCRMCSNRTAFFSFFSISNQNKTRTHAYFARCFVLALLQFETRKAKLWIIVIMARRVVSLVASACHLPCLIQHTLYAVHSSPLIYLHIVGHDIESGMNMALF